MKKPSSSASKLPLRRETLRPLDPAQLAEVDGGSSFVCITVVGLVVGAAGYVYALTKS